MITYILQRVSLNDKCTFGVLKDDKNIPFLVTLELPWKNNQPNISCIPEGNYKCLRTDSPKHGICFELQGVPNRNDIQVHAGNYPHDSLGCILVGLEFGDDSSIILSKKALSKFMDKLDNINEFNLRIIND